MSATHILFLLPLGWAAVQQPGTVTIDTQQWRDRPLRHLYVHGVLNGDTAFHLFMPPREEWRGRVLQYLQGGLGGSEQEGVRMGHHLYALANGAVYVESSQGHTGNTFYQDDDTPAELDYEASYAVIQYAKARAVELYGEEPRFTYVFGGSGGGVRSTSLLERFAKTYDGAVPVVGAGDLKFIVFTHSVFEAFRPAIQPRVEALAAATRLRESGDPFAALQSAEERRALGAILSSGYPRNSLWLVRPLAVGITILDFLKYKVVPGYFEDFWSKPGYAGADGECKPALVEGREAVVRSADPAKRRVVIDANKPDMELFGYTAVFTSGELKGQWRRVLANIGGTLLIGQVGPGIEAVRPGDRLRLDNRDLLAFRALHRYLGEAEFGAAATRPAVRVGVPELPGRTPGRFQGKMIAVFGADDPLMWPLVAVRYHRRVKEAWGEKAGEHFRLHFIEHGVHGAPLPTALYRQVPNQAAVRKALDDLMAWVERGVAPPAGTEYTLGEMNQIEFPRSAAARKGYQPVVRLSATEQARVATFRVETEDPDNEVIRVEMDFEGDGKFDQAKEVRGRQVTAEFEHRHESPGTYFPTVRVTDSTASKGSEARGIQNLASVRLVVH